MAEQLQHYRVYVCHGPQCAQRDARTVWRTLLYEVQRRGLDERCEFIVSGCQGRCDFGPNINVYPNLTKYSHLTPQKVERIVAEHFEAGTAVDDLRHPHEW